MMCMYKPSGMRLSLPETIDKVPITSVTAYDISSVANEVYRHNFHRDESHKLDEKGGMLCPKLVSSLCIYARSCVRLLIISKTKF